MTEDLATSAYCSSLYIGLSHASAVAHAMSAFYGKSLNSAHRRNQITSDTNTKIGMIDNIGNLNKLGNYNRNRLDRAPPPVREI
jgi:hypothetical protein